MDAPSSTTASSSAGNPSPGPLPEEEGGKNRKRAALATAPFLALGLADVVLILLQGLQPLWGFAILPPILFCSVLSWIVFSTDFLDDRT
ncbi:hypothetical protein E6P09_11245 [Haloferax mediterranei ATCC 33500]|uniref:DUF8142 domain-containing protein n=1 Tax=Haloferax mediterranei (strain ATCC 33500 / DSM 1411 / JCM 8866 / NBRC 14739 / NCIMB 2177 / R-4) TaxID=523841 RepID=I3R537_HALMT|nr:hypothetical protein [Haloferax mediterranei]AFK19347.1 hypothetical protein HFX_1641 [Haloferax mediterranei ATCC 33500]AHZ21298.1 hypothetical protein BM92_00900 [Haloferax mediterranei ATCC 33500]EMA04462.1 hypothetical protein C439_02267 [Haloferax mediterranei ATCC 33500]MDX5989452.1 hypothetical protein [Haloferax mediterranei ATCC 33500]QCQ75815.1 hypothetical protein E6P09_11245 [Haloferax mediterranei ATCC 33500]